jgi:hypothetical protein
MERKPEHKGQRVKENDRSGYYPSGKPRRMP